MLICHFTHHKCGSKWFHNILSCLGTKTNKRYQLCGKFDCSVDIWMQHHSIVDFDILPKFKGTHMVRDPRDMLVSAYFYHLWTTEKWCVKPNKKYSGKSYQEQLASLPKEEGLLFELENYTRETLERVLAWDYNNPDILEIKYEDVITDPEKWFIYIYKHYGLSRKYTDIGMQIAREQHFTNKSSKHIREATPGDWVNHLTELHIDRLYSLFGEDVLSRLKY